MSTKAYVTPVVESTAVFKADLFKGKVLFCTGGGSGICKEMTRAMVTRPEPALDMRKSSLISLSKDASRS